MSRLRLLVVVFAAACLVFWLAVQLQPATPQAETGIEMPAGITRQDHRRGSAAPLLLRGQSSSSSASPCLPQELSWSSEASSSLALVYVESGVLSVRINAPVTLTRVAAGGSPGEPESVPAGTAFTADADDFVVSPPRVAVEARNDGASRSSS